jgi:hypothetical protein
MTDTGGGHLYAFVRCWLRRDCAHRPSDQRMQAWAIMALGVKEKVASRFVILSCTEKSHSPAHFQRRKGRRYLVAMTRRILPRIP